jgi:hypothetical protein
MFNVRMTMTYLNCLIRSKLFSFFNARNVSVTKVKQWKEVGIFSGGSNNDRKLSISIKDPDFGKGLGRPRKMG